MKVLAGDWPTDSNVTLRRNLFGPPTAVMIQRGVFSFDRMPMDQIRSAEIVTADNYMSVGRKLGWGVAGAVVLGPIGAVVGAIAGGNMREQVVAVAFKDGRKVMIKGKKKRLEPILAAGFGARDA